MKKHLELAREAKKLLKLTEQTLPLLCSNEIEQLIESLNKCLK